MSEKGHLRQAAKDKVLLLTGHPLSDGFVRDMAIPDEWEPDVNVQKQRHDVSVPRLRPRPSAFPGKLRPHPDVPIELPER